MPDGSSPLASSPSLRATPPRRKTHPSKPGRLTSTSSPRSARGLFFEDSDSSVTNNGYFLVRIPAFVFPRLNDASLGVQVELSNAPRLRGVDYSVLSYARIRLTKAADVGANVRLFHGASKTGTEFSLHATPVVGVRFTSTGSSQAQLARIQCRSTLPHQRQGEQPGVFLHFDFSRVIHPGPPLYAAHANAHCSPAVAENR